MTAKQEAFCHAIAKGATGADAYRVAFGQQRMSDKTVHEQAARLLASPKVDARIAALKAPATLAAQEAVLVDLTWAVLQDARLAGSDVRKLFHKDTGELKSPHELDDDTAAAVEHIEVTKLFSGGGEGKRQIGTITKVKLASKHPSLERLMRHFGGFENDNKQKADSVANVPRDILKLIEERLDGLKQRRLG